MANVKGKDADGVAVYLKASGAGTDLDPAIPQHLETNSATVLTDLGGVTETAPATDTASSGHNGRLQRIAQRITSLIALLPAALGQTTKSASLAVTVASDDDLQGKLGALTETAPATDTASSGLNGRLQRIAQRLTSLIALIPTALGQTTKSASLAVTVASDDDLQGKLGSLTETAPATDTASSGLNGRLQRIAQRLTSVLAVLPAALGGTTAAASLPVALSSDGTFATLTGAVTETAPATDTASSGLNGRLQRIAQRLTSLIALVPAALGQGTMAQSLRVVVASDQATYPVTATVALPTTIYNGKKTVTTAGTRVTLASSQAILSGVTIKALAGNTGTIYVGDGSVASTTGYALAAGDSVFLEVANLTTVNLDSSVNGEGVTYIGT